MHSPAEEAIAIPLGAPDAPVKAPEAFNLDPEHLAAVPVLCRHISCVSHSVMASLAARHSGKPLNRRILLQACLHNCGDSVQARKLR